MRKIVCRFCGCKEWKTAGYRYNTAGRVRRYKCMSCGKKFTHDTFYIKLRYKAKVVNKCVDLHNRGLSYRAVEEHLKRNNEKAPSHMSVYRWSMRIGKLATKFMNMFKVNGQDSLLHADETEMMLKGDYFWNWNVIMKGNRFLLVNFSSLTRNMESAKAVFREAKNKLIGLPLKIITDGLPAYPGAINSAFYRLSYPRVEHVVSPGFEGRPDNNFVERIHNEIQARVITMRGFKSFESAAATMSLWALFYNFLRSHAALSGKTPAEAAGLGSYTLSGIIGEAYEQDRRDKRTG